MFRTKDANGNVKYAGRSAAIVRDNRDPLNKGRIIVDHPLLGNTVWIDYLRVPGVFTVPSIGDLVFVECDAGMPEFAIAWGNVTKGKDANPEIPAQFKRTIPTNRGFYTPGGHFFEMDDGVATVTDNPDDKQFTTAGRGVRLTTRKGNKIHVIEDEDAAQHYILLEDVAGNMIKLDTQNKSIEINAVENQNNVIGKNYQIVVEGFVQIQVVGNVSLECADIDVKATSAVVETTGNVVATIGGSAQIAVTGDAEIDAATIKLNGSAGDILTTVTDPVVDTIFGVPTVGVPTVKSG